MLGGRADEMVADLCINIAVAATGYGLGRRAKAPAILLGSAILTILLAIIGYSAGQSFFSVFGSTLARLILFQLMYLVGLHASTV